MSRMRVYELAKEVNITSKRLIEELNKNGILVTNHMSSIEISNKDVSKIIDKIKKIKTEKNKSESINIISEESENENKNVKEKDNMVRVTKKITISVDRNKDKFKIQESLHKSFDDNKFNVDNLENHNDSRRKFDINKLKNNRNLSYKKKFVANHNYLNKNFKVNENANTNNTETKVDTNIKQNNSDNRIIERKNKFIRYNHDSNRNYKRSTPSFKTQTQSKPNYQTQSKTNYTGVKKYPNKKFNSFDHNNNNRNFSVNKEKNSTTNMQTNTSRVTTQKSKYDNNKNAQTKNKSFGAFIFPQNNKPDSKQNFTASKNYKSNQLKESKKKLKEKSISELKLVKSRAKKRKVKKEKENYDVAIENDLKSSEVKVFTLPKIITLKILADKINKPVSELIKALMSRGLMFDLNKNIDFSLAKQIAEKFDIMVELEEESEIDSDSDDDLTNDDDADKVERPPVVVVMGHVDHGKTSLLDAIRHTNVTSTEAGGITQHIGAYTVPINNKSITFLDTPGHEAFTAMRMRGAQATDIAVLVIAADDGIMPQTIEAINHAKAAEISIIVAINKIDKPGANIERVKHELVEYGLVPEEWGGDTICVPVSAKNNIGIEDLLEMIVILAQMKELKANPNKLAHGIVIESCLDKGRGPISTVLVQEGTLKVGDAIVIGNSYGKIRAIFDDKGKHVYNALPSMPVEILGLSSVAKAGDAFRIVKSEKQARILAENNLNKSINDDVSKISLNDLFHQIKVGNTKKLNIIIKGDVQGSIEAVKNSLEHLSNEEIKIRTIHSGVGTITESDIMLASTSNAIVIGFNVRPDSSVKSMADREKVDIRLYQIIYDAIKDIKSAVTGLLDPIYQEKVIGHAKIIKLFKSSKLGMIGGSYVADGKIVKDSKIRLIRDGVVVHDGEILGLQRDKDDVKEVVSGYECGILLNKFNDIKEGDVIESYIIEKIPRVE